MIPKNGRPNPTRTKTTPSITLPTSHLTRQKSKYGFATSRAKPLAAKFTTMRIPQRSNRCIIGVDSVLWTYSATTVNSPIVVEHDVVLQEDRAFGAAELG